MRERWACPAKPHCKSTTPKYLVRALEAIEEVFSQTQPLTMSAEDYCALFMRAKPVKDNTPIKEAESGPDEPPATGESC